MQCIAAFEREEPVGIGEMNVAESKTGDFSMPELGRWSETVPWLGEAESGMGRWGAYPGRPASLEKNKVEKARNRWEKEVKSLQKKLLAR